MENCVHSKQTWLSSTLYANDKTARRSRVNFLVRSSKNSPVGCKQLAAAAVGARLVYQQPNAEGTETRLLNQNAPLDTPRHLLHYYRLLYTHVYWSNHDTVRLRVGRYGRNTTGTKFEVTQEKHRMDKQSSYFTYNGFEFILFWFQSDVPIGIRQITVADLRVLVSEFLMTRRIL